LQTLSILLVIENKYNINNKAIEAAAENHK